MNENEYHPILYLYEHQYAPQDIVLWKNDEDLQAADLPHMETSVKRNMPQRVCVGIGTYKTVRDGEIYLCVLLDPVTKKLEAYSIGVYRSGELVGKALQNLFQSHEQSEQPVIIRSSKNPLYRTEVYKKILLKYPVIPEMTEKGTRGGVAVVSTFFSQLMRKKGGYVFQTWQEAVDWLMGCVEAGDLGS
ncbi:hypothetical protein [Ruminococcus gauvreauii]|uniref:Integrase catalytic domain-containing protein n=1 Tax=Ruminococcus gauvreauii TaxID=438033 RepID=A0ABY5VL46_9FIRM|nr:hypothetical protein [Ruminococcus gauvreauii]UWP60758.1 hypothetical protein NQ502_06905 [Ruminococcus gauvreauii]